MRRAPRLYVAVGKDPVGRQTWIAEDLDAPEIGSLWMALLRYRRAETLIRVPRGDLVGSLLPSGQQAPVIDLDIPHRLVPSRTDGHGHLYLDVRMSYARWVCLMIGLRLAGVIEQGNFWWSLRRGQNFVRTEVN